MNTKDQDVLFGFLVVDQSAAMEGVGSEDNNTDTAAWITTLRKLECCDTACYYYSATGWNFNAVSDEGANAKYSVYIYNGEQGKQKDELFPCSVRIYQKEELQSGKQPDKGRGSKSFDGIGTEDDFFSKLNFFFCRGAEQ